MPSYGDKKLRNTKEPKAKDIHEMTTGELRIHARRLENNLREARQLNIELVDVVADLNARASKLEDEQHYSCLSKQETLQSMIDGLKGTVNSLTRSRNECFDIAQKYIRTNGALRDHLEGLSVGVGNSIHSLLIAIERINEHYEFSDCSDEEFVSSGHTALYFFMAGFNFIDKRIMDDTTLSFSEKKEKAFSLSIGDDIVHFARERANSLCEKEEVLYIDSLPVHPDEDYLIASRGAWYKDDQIPF